MIAEKLVDNNKIAQRMRFVFLTSILICVILGVLSLFNLIYVPKDVSLFFVTIGVLLGIEYLLGSSLLPNRTGLIKRDILEEYKNSPVKPVQNMNEVLDTEVHSYTVSYINSHLRLGLATIITLILVFLDSYLMNLFGLTTFHLLGFTIFRDIGIIGLFLILLFFYRSYAEDPKASLYENLSNYKRPSATGRRDLK